MIKRLKILGLKKVFYSVLLVILVSGAIAICLPTESTAILVFFSLATLGFILLGVIGIIFKEIPSLLIPIKGLIAIITGIIYIVMGSLIFIYLLRIIIDKTIRG